MTRQLVDGTTAPDLDQTVELKVRTRAPSKYLLVDLETGQVYRGNGDVGRTKDWQKLPESNLLITIRM